MGFSNITLDLTRHKELERCEREKREINLILEAAESGTWKWYVDTGRVEVSQHLLNLLGHTTADSIRDIDEWLRFVHPDDRDTIRSHLHAARERLPDSRLEAEIRLVRNDGTYAWFFMRASWFRERQDMPFVFMGVAVCIDSLKAAETEHERLVQQLSQERNRCANILAQMPSAVLLAAAPSGRLVYMNQAAETLFGRGLAAVDNARARGRYKFFDSRGNPVRPEELPLARSIAGRQNTCNEELVLERDDGSRAHLVVTATSIVDSDGVTRLAVAVLHDVTSLKQAQLSAATEKERAEVTLAALTDGVMTIDRRATILSMNPAAERLTGLRLAEDRGRSFTDAVQFDESDSGLVVMEAVQFCLEERRVISSLPHVSLKGADGQHYSVESAVAPVILADGELLGAVLVFHDVTETKRLMRRLGWEASHDALTGLVNRREFEARLQRTLIRAQHPGGDAAALLFLDLDQFKIVNDTCGHAAGDELLKLLAHSYQEHLRERDTLARIGGDEFGVIVEHCGLDEAIAIAHKLLDATRDFRYTCKGRVFQLGVSIGLTPIDSTIATIEEALRRADHACYMAKERGRNRVYVHYEGDVDFAQRRSDMHWVTRLSQAFQNDQLQLYCQPIMSLGEADQRAHYEILLRLKNEHGAPIGPARFLPAAERYDVILKIDRWVLTKTLEWLSRNPEHTATLDMCSINLSRRSLGDQSFHQFAADLIDKSQVPAEKLCFEITENGAIADMQKTIAFIEALSARGCRFSLDDFGIGMTSFSYLKQLPVDFIKIDGSFIQMMSSSEVDYEMVRFTNDISHMMGRKTIAEYVTDQSILKHLKEIGVDFAQGYWVGKPRPLELAP
jgi:diguanylate cyclase (GGDEF)-like protein/PAS domain S-box-containing protein